VVITKEEPSWLTTSEIASATVVITDALLEEPSQLTTSEIASGHFQASEEPTG
jgi:hypothetical protein